MSLAKRLHNEFIYIYWFQVLFLPIKSVSFHEKGKAACDPQWGQLPKWALSSCYCVPRTHSLFKTQLNSQPILPWLPPGIANWWKKLRKKSRLRTQSRTINEAPTRKDAAWRAHAGWLLAEPGLLWLPRTWIAYAASCLMVGSWLDPWCFEEHWGCSSPS